MDWSQVQSRLYDLPPTYLRTGNIFSWLQNSYAAGLTFYTQSIDGIAFQYDFAQAQGNWLNTWGALFNMPRQTTETDTTYRNRMQFTLKLGRTTPVAIQLYAQDALGYENTVTENFSTVSWKLTLTSSITQASDLSLANGLNVVRPAGVPFLPIYIPSGGLYLGSINYLGAPSVTGAYLVESTTAVIPAISASTNPAQSPLPTTYLTDPTLNPSLA